MKNSILLKITLTPIICVLIIMSTQIGIEYYPLSFGLVIGFMNWNNYKYGLFIGIILSLLASYFSFFIAYFTVYLLVEIFNSILGQDTGGVTALLVSSFIIAPLLMFYLYKFVFNYSRTKVTNYIILYAVILLIIISCLFYYFTDYKFVRFLKRIRLDHYTIWQIVMALGIQLIIYQKEIWNKQRLK